MTKYIVPNLVRFEADGLEFIVETSKGLAYASKRATARMLGVDEKTVRNEIERADYFIVTNAKIQTSGGLQSADLVPAHVVFKLALKFNHDLAEKMGEAGANLYMLNAAGYKMEVKERPIVDPTMLGEGFYNWEDLKNPKVRRQVQNLLKRNKSNGSIECWYDPSGLYFMEFLNAATGKRVCTLFANAENKVATDAINRVITDLLDNGAKHSLLPR
jgi:hypothetical protein